MHWTIWILLGLLLGGWGGRGFAAEESDLQVWVVSGNERIFPPDPPGPVTEARLAAARNEYEPFQVALRTEGRPVENVRAAVTDLTGPGGAVIPANQLTLYREHYVYLRRPSYRSAAQPGLYPDALIPFVNPLDGSEIPPWTEENRHGAKYKAVPFTLWPRFNEVLWVEVFVPRDTPAGEYRGALRITARNQPEITVPITLTVWNFTLPDTPTVKSEFGGFGRVAEAHGVARGTDEYLAIERRYCEALAAHRITPPIPSHLYPRVKEDGTVDPTETHAAFKEYLETLHVNAISVPLPPFPDWLGANREKAKRYWRSFYDYLAENGWADRNYIYILDEPNDAEAYEEVRRRAALAHEAHPRLRVLCTEQTKTQDPEWGVLDGAVDIWVPLWPLHDPETAAQRLAAGDELWSYTALCQGPPNTLWWQIDFPLLNYRLALWGNWRDRMVGLLYWTTVYWGHVKDPWLDQPSFRLAYNGEGMLFYPGAEAGFPGPVASLRLKAIREGMEDYEYFHLLQQAGEGAFVDRLVRELMPSWTEWNPDPAAYARARTQMAARLEAAGGPR
jgi:hypothetical protein